MATRKGNELAGILGEWIGTTPAIRETCSRICRWSATFDRLAEEECNGPTWVSSPYATNERIAEWQEKLEARQARLERYIVNAVESLPETDFGAIRVLLGGDPRGFVVKLVIPTASGLVGVGVAADGAHHGCYVDAVA